MTKKAIIIAAGRGRRLMPYTDQMPKCLVPIDERTILDIQLAALRTHGVSEIVIIRGYLGHVLSERDLGPGVRFVDNADWEHNNILESLFCARDDIHGPLYLSYSDILFTPGVVRRLAKAAGDICLVIDRGFREIYRGRTEHPLTEAEVAALDDDGSVLQVGKRSLPVNLAAGEFIGLAKLSDRGSRWFVDTWTELEEHYRDRAEEPFQRALHFRQAYLTDLLQELIARGRRLDPVIIEGSWREIDTVQDLERARQMVNTGAWT